jgi:hypothetical protein
MADNYKKQEKAKGKIEAKQLNRLCDAKFNVSTCDPFGAASLNFLQGKLKGL